MRGKNIFVHESSYIDEDVVIGTGTKIWYFCHVQSGASIGANATIICGNTIGKYAMIAAEAVATRDVPDYALMAGVPAKQIGWICECGNILDNGFVCEKCKREIIFNSNENDINI